MKVKPENESTNSSTSNTKRSSHTLLPRMTLSSVYPDMYISPNPSHIQNTTNFNLINEEENEDRFCYILACGAFFVLIGLVVLLILYS